MSFAFKCDRCKTFSESSPKFIRAGREEFEPKYEICQVCWVEFDKFLRMEK